MGENIGMFLFEKLKCWKKRLNGARHSAWIFFTLSFFAFWNVSLRRREQNVRTQSSLGWPLTNGVPSWRAIAPAADLRASAVWAKAMATRYSSRSTMHCSVWKLKWSGKPGHVPFRLGLRILPNAALPSLSMVSLMRPVVRFDSPVQAVTQKGFRFCRNNS